MSCILPLQPDAIAQLQSSKHILSLQGVVVSLVENSLDASSSKVEVSLDFNRGACTVEDNGVGIATAEFSETGGLGKMYHTSKHPSSQSDLHGHSGTYLASLAALSLLTIKSGRSDGEGSATLRIHQGRVVARYVPSLPRQEISASTSHGTQIMVQDLFGNMPVRVKQRALAAENSSMDGKVWDELKRSIVGLLLAWNRPCSVRIKDVNEHRRNLHLSAQYPTTSNALTEKGLKMIMKANVKFDLNDTLPILIQAGLSPPESRLAWIAVSASTSNLTVKGFINLTPVPTKGCQFLSIGVHPCGTDSAFGTLYDCINKMFFNSSFGCLEQADVLDVDDAEKDRRKRDRRYKSNGYTQKQLLRRKGVDKWPMFVLQVRFQDSQRARVGVENVGDASLRAVVDILEAAVLQWLETNQFCPQKRKKRRNEDQDVPSASSSPVPSLLAADTLGRRAKWDPVHTPALKRTHTPEARSISTRRKYMDLNGKSRYLDDHPANKPWRSDYFRSWSRVKSSREGLYDELWQEKKNFGVVSHPVAQKDDTISPPMKPVLTLLSLDKGTLSTVGPAANPLSEILSNKDGIQSPLPHDPTHLHSSSDDFGSVDDKMPLLAAEAAQQSHIDGDGVGSASDRILDWMDPITKQTFRVNSRTGVVLPTTPVHPPDNIAEIAFRRPESRHAEAINTALTSKCKTMTLSRRPRSAVKSGDKQWLPGFLKEWNNPIFSPQAEEKIPVASMEGPGAAASEHLDKHCGHFDQAQNSTEIGVTRTAKMTKAGLRGAKVMRQVDQKFILCKIVSDGDGGRSEMLVLVDQHAASERAILETLFAELCSPPEESFTGTATVTSKVKTQLLIKPLRFQVSSIEHQLFGSFAQHFANWGIMYDLRVRRETQTSSQVRPLKEEYLVIVSALPPVIVERSVQLPNLVIDLLRSEVHSAAPAGRITPHPPTQSADSGRHRWLSRIGSCPKRLVEMLDSRACRSAIMFNDELSIEQCKELMARLADCAFPFICAHGRVSMVPLMNLDESELGFQGSSDSAEKRDAAQFVKWLAKRDQEIR